jgi:hypothetical protein
LTLVLVIEFFADIEIFRGGLGANKHHPNFQRHVELVCNMHKNLKDMTFKV